MKNCIFCQIASGKLPCDKLYEDERVIAFRDLHPQAPTHVLLIPKKHIATINDLEEADEALVGHLYGVARQIAEQEGISQEGYRTVMNCNAAAGQTVFHIHLHLLGGRQMSWPPG